MRPAIVACLDAGTVETMLALPGLLALARDCDVNIDWQPLGRVASRLSNKQPEETGNDPIKAYKARRQRARGASSQRELERSAERLGIGLDAAARNHDTFLMNAAFLWTLDRGDDPVMFLNAAFSAAVRYGEDVGDVSRVAAIVGDAAFGRYAREEAPERLDRVAGSMLERGIYAAPAFIVSDEVFQGRQHFPLMRWLLGDRSESPPV